MTFRVESDATRRCFCLFSPSRTTSCFAAVPAPHHPSHRPYVLFRRFAYVFLVNMSSLLTDLPDRWLASEGPTSRELKLRLSPDSIAALTEQLKAECQLPAGRQREECVRTLLLSFIRVEVLRFDGQPLEKYDEERESLQPLAPIQVALLSSDVTVIARGLQCPEVLTVWSALACARGVAACSGRGTRGGAPRALV